MAVQRWVFTDTVAPETYTVPINPREMDSPFPAVQASAQAPVGLDYNRPLVTVGPQVPTDWAFRGAVLDAAHYEALRHWVYDKDYRIKITDHFGRELHCLLTRFVPTPKRALNRPWRHDYEVAGIVFSVGAATVGI